MALSLTDILDQFRYDVEKLPGLVAAYCTVTLEPTPPTVQLWTILSRRDTGVERQLAGAERRLLEVFPRVRFDFTTTHLLGRDPRQFIPEGAIEILSDPDLSQAFRTRRLQHA
jgi:hypothetical protein